MAAPALGMPMAMAADPSLRYCALWVDRSIDWLVESWGCECEREGGPLVHQSIEMNNARTLHDDDDREAVL